MPWEVQFPSFVPGGDEIGLNARFFVLFRFVRGSLLFQTLLRS